MVIYRAAKETFGKKKTTRFDLPCNPELADRLEDFWCNCTNGELKEAVQKSADQLGTTATYNPHPLTIENGYGLNQGYKWSNGAVFEVGDVETDSMIKELLKLGRPNQLVILFPYDSKGSEMENQEDRLVTIYSRRPVPDEQIKEVVEALANELETYSLKEKPQPAQLDRSRLITLIQD